MIPARRKELKGKAFVKSVKIFAAMFLTFLMLAFMRKDQDFLTSGSMITGIFICLTVFRGVTLYLITHSIENIIITVDDEKIARSGKGLLASNMKFHEIKKVRRNSQGLILLKKETSGEINLQTSRTPYETEEEIIFIPFTIEGFADLEKLISEKRKVH